MPSHHGDSMRSLRESTAFSTMFELAGLPGTALAVLAAAFCAALVWRNRRGKGI